MNESKVVDIGKNSNNKGVKIAVAVIVLIIAVIYFISPVDLAPGILIDDFIALFIALAPFFKTTSEA